MTVHSFSDHIREAIGQGERALEHLFRSIEHGQKARAMVWTSYEGKGIIARRRAEKERVDIEKLTTALRLLDEVKRSQNAEV